MLPALQLPRHPASIAAAATGAVSVVAMERTSVQGDSDARQQDVATGIANEWVARLQKDELNWKVTAPTDTTVARAATSYLNNSYVPGTCGPVGAAASGSYVPTFYAPNIGLTITPTTGEGRGYAYDIFGHDSTDYANAVYCVALSECFQDGPTSNNLIQATVLVYWGRKIASNPASGWCPSSTANFTSTTFDPQVYRSVTSTVLLQAGGGQK